MKTKADQLMHPVLTVILKIKVVFTTIAVVAGVVKIFQNLDAAMMVDWFEVFLAVVAIYGAWLMLQTKKLGFYLVTIPNLIIGIMSLFYLPYMAKGVWMSFGQIALIMLLMLLQRNGKNAYQVLWGKANVTVENNEEGLTTELTEEPEETPRNPQESDLWERIEALPEDTVEQIHYKLGLVNTYVDSCPDGMEIDKARSLYKYLDLLEKQCRMEKERRDEERREEEDWRRLDKDDYYAMRDFKQKYHHSIHKNELEDFMWRYTENNMSPEQLKRYCDDWGNDGGKHIHNAQRWLEAFDVWSRINWHDVFELKHFIDRYSDFPPALIQYNKLRDEVMRDVRTNYIGDRGYLRRLVCEGVASKEYIRECYVKNYAKSVRKSGTILADNKKIFLEQVRMMERVDVATGNMTQEEFVQKLMDLFGYYADLELEDYRGWVEEDTYNKLIDAMFPL